MNTEDMRQHFEPDGSGVWFGGIVATGYVFDHWNTIKLEQPDGYKIDLLLRFREWADSYGSKVAVKYWITDKPMTKEQAQEGFLRTMLGSNHRRHGGQ